MKTLAHQRDKSEILERLKGLRPDSVRHWGRLSAHQMVCHVGDGLRMATGQKPVTLDASFFKRTILKWVVLYVPLRWPHGIMTSPEIDQERGGTKPVEFATDVAQVVALVEVATSPGCSLHQQLHPFFGRMSDAAWLRWAYLHMDHHLRQFGA
jgi:hypothetical protein